MMKKKIKSDAQKCMKTLTYKTHIVVPTFRQSDECTSPFITKREFISTPYDDIISYNSHTHQWSNYQKISKGAHTIVNANEAMLLITGGSRTSESGGQIFSEIF